MAQHKRHDMPERDLIDDALDSWARERPDLKVQPVAVVMRINRLAAHFQAELDAVFAEFGLTNPSFELLATLRRAGHPYRLSQRQLGQTLGLTAGTVSLRVKYLQRQGLVRVEPDPTDRRVTRVSLTNRGQRRFDDAAPAHLAGEEDLLRALSTDEQAALARLLRKLLLSFEGAPASLTPARAIGLRVRLRKGTSSRPTPPATAARRAPAGVRVSNVEPNSPAADAGLRPGDVIVAVAGHPVRSLGSLNRAIAVARRAGQIPIRIHREARHQDVVVTMTGQPPILEQPDEGGEPAGPPSWGR
jgi:DNA-binding MarR family transcriptional regulator